MIDHLTIHVSDLQASKRFYLAVLAPLGYAVRKEVEDGCGFGNDDGGSGGDPHGDFWIVQGTPMTPRLHVAFRAKGASGVQAFHQAGLAAGGRDNGGPGLRPQYHDRYYGAFLFDPDGYNVEAVFHGGEQG